MKNAIILSGILLVLSACSLSHKIGKQAGVTLLNDSIARHAHIGISLYEPSTGKYWYQHDADKFFVPASNTKLFSLYAGMRYIGDSLPGYSLQNQTDTAYLLPTGDPTFLDPEYAQQNVFTLLNGIHKPIALINIWNEEALGRGWSWDDYNSDDMIERSAFPIYNNLIRWTQDNRLDGRANNGDGIFSSPAIHWRVKMHVYTANQNFIVTRAREDNFFEVFPGKEKRQVVRIPFATHGLASALALLSDTLHKPVYSTGNIPLGNFTIIHSRPSDSLYIPMMHRSDNFFAEQTLLMASQARLGVMNDRQMVNYLLSNDLVNIPQRPSWVDGSGLSRYNLFTPMDFVYILNKLRNDFGFERLKVILPTGGTGTLSSLFKKDSGYIFAKTGTLSNHLALSGYLITKQDRLLIFSILVNGFQGPATPMRRKIEKFISGIRQHY